MNLFIPRRHPEGGRTMTTRDELALHVDDLLQHAKRPHPIHPDLITFKGPGGGHGIAVVVDGYYSKKDAEGMVGFWRTVLRRTLDEVAKVDPYSAETVGR